MTATSTFHMVVQLVPPFHAKTVRKWDRVNRVCVIICECDTWELAVNVNVSIRWAQERVSAQEHVLIGNAITRMSKLD